MHFSNVDGMRGLACLIVLVDHAAVLVFPELTAGLTGCGKIGV